VSEPTNSPTDPMGTLASGVLTDLYWAVCGLEPKAVRAYREDDALLLLLRFETDEIQEHPGDGFESVLFEAFNAMPAMIAAAVEARTGRRLSPGNMLLCAERGLAVLAFSTIDEELDACVHEDLFGGELESAGRDEDLFRVDSETFSRMYGDPPVLPLAS
jgi:hypothetical protein